MRFAPSALAVLAFGLSMAEARKYTKEDIDAMLENGQIDKEKLFSYARPVRRRADENGAGDEADEAVDADDADDSDDLPITGDSTIRFNSCMSFPVEDYGLVEDETLLEYAKQGTIVAQQSFVLFDVEDCVPGECVFDESDKEKVFMVPLEIYVTSMTGYYPDKRQTYCESCEQHYNYCTQGNGLYYDTATYYNGNSYCYNDIMYELINCHECFDYGCFYTNGNNYEYGYQQYKDGYDQNVGGWVEEINECRDLGSAWNNYELYAGLMCNEAGDGVEIGVFVDEDCRYYHKGKNIQKVMSNDDWYYYYQSNATVQFMFTKSLSCKGADENVKYINAYQPIYTNPDQNDDANGDAQGGADNADAADDAADDADEGNAGDCSDIEYGVNYGCSNLFEMGLSMPLSTCESSFEFEEYEEPDDDEFYNWDYYGLYEYEIGVEQVYNASKVCQMVSNQYGNAGHMNVYDDAESGSLYEYNDEGLDKKGRKSSWRVSPGDAFAFALVAACVAFLVVFAVRRYMKSKKTQLLHLDAPDKELPLVT